VLDQFIAPAADGGDAFADVGQHFGNARVDDDQIAARPSTGGRQPPTLGPLFASERGPRPNAGPHARSFHLPSQVGHIGISGSELRHWTGALRRGAPSHVDHHIGAIVDIRGYEFRHQLRVLHDAGRGGVFPVSVIPVVAAIDGLRGQQRFLAHHAAKGAGRVERRFTRFANAVDDRCYFQASRSQFNPAPAVAHIEPQSDAAVVGLPVAHRRGARLHTIAAGNPLRRGEKIPRHEALAGDSAPLKIAVRPLPVIAQKTRACRERAMPAHEDASKLGFRRGDGYRDFAALVGLGRYLDILRLPSVTRSRQVNGAGSAFHKCSDAVRRTSGSGKDGARCARRMDVPAIVAPAPRRNARRSVMARATASDGVGN
jgi:hypothetical protein